MKYSDAILVLSKLVEKQPKKIDSNYNRYSYVVKIKSQRIYYTNGHFLVIIPIEEEIKDGLFQFENQNLLPAFLKKPKTFEEIKPFFVEHKDSSLNYPDVEKVIPTEDNSTNLGLSISELNKVTKAFDDLSNYIFLSLNSKNACIFQIENRYSESREFLAWLIIAKASKYFEKEVI